MTHKLRLDPNPVGTSSLVNQPGTRQPHTYRVMGMPEGETGLVHRFHSRPPIWRAVWSAREGSRQLSIPLSDSETPQGALVVFEQWMNDPGGHAAAVGYAARS